MKHCAYSLPVVSILSLLMLPACGGGGTPLNSSLPTAQELSEPMPPASKQSKRPAPPKANKKSDDTSSHPDVEQWSIQFISKLSTEEISHLTQDEVKRIKPVLVKAFTARQIAAIHPEAIVGWNILHLAQFNSEQIQSLTLEQKSKLSQAIPNLRYATDPTGQVQQFSLVNVAGNGDCAFHALAQNEEEKKTFLNRTTFLEQILAHSHLREMRVLFLGELPWEDRAAPVKAVSAALIEDENEFKQYMKDHMSSPRYFLSFTPQYYRGVHVVDDNSGSLAALALLNRLNVRIWREEDPGSLELTLSAEFLNSDLDSKPFRNIYIGGNHFQKLQKISLSKN